MKNNIRSFFLISLCAFVLSNNTIAQDKAEDYGNPIIWQQDFEEAQREVKIKNKYLLVYFTGSDWCGPCKMLDSDFFESNEFIDIAKKDFTLYKADTPRNLSLISESQKRDNNRLKKKYKITSFPVIVILNNRGKLLGKMKGYNLLRDTSYHFNFIESVLN